MSRAVALALAVTLYPGCLDPRASDTPGFSRNVLPAKMEVPSVASDEGAARKIDQNDGVGASVTQKKAFAAGQSVLYWDLGTAKASPSPAYQIARCTADGLPVPEGDPAAISHPLLIDAAPGDGDYTQLWAISTVCVTDAYRGQHIASAAALNDAVDMGLVQEPQKATAFAHFPVVAAAVTLATMNAPLQTAYYRGFAVSYVDFGLRGILTPVDGKVTTNNVYEIMRPGEKTPVRIVFSLAPGDANYTPIWSSMTAIVASDADLDSFKSEADLVTVKADRSVSPVGPSVIAVYTNSLRVARPMPAPPAPTPPEVP